MVLEQPIRGELLSAARMVELASHLAQQQREIKGPGLSLRMLVPRLRANRSVLADAHAVLADAARLHQTITPAAEWFLDNFHLIEDHLEAGIHQATLPRLTLLPVPANVEGLRQPRILLIAEAFVAHTDSHFDAELLRSYLTAYQAEVQLTLAELWAVPATLRYLLLENLRRLGARVATSHQERAMADAYADQLLAPGVAEHAPRDDVPRGLPSGEIRPAFTTRLVHRLRDREDEATRIPHWLLTRLAAQGTDYAREVAHEYASQVAANQTVRNAFISLSLIASFDWPRFIEAQSAVNSLLARTAGYLGMDFETRDTYRKAVEQLAHVSGRAETAIAQAVISEVEAAVADPQAIERTRDPGYFLLAGGRVEFEARLGIRPSVLVRLGRAARARAVPLYLLALATITLLLILPALAASWTAGVTLPGLTVLAVVSLLPASDLASLLIHRVSAWLVKPRRLPRLDFSEGVPPACRTLVAVPTLLANRVQIVEQVAMLEQHYLTNSKGDIYFALLSDWRDADAPTDLEDTSLLEFARANIAKLNDRYGGSQESGNSQRTHEDARFHLFHRRRTWSDTEQRWLGWERKRGKLEELNRLLGGARDTNFLGVGNEPPAIPENVRYVVTLDADTRMPYGTVSQLVGTAAHPLNRPVLDARRKVSAGYALFQPRVTPCLADDTENSIFQKVYSGPSGLDPYAGAVSDLYQDLFDEGSYTGKGLYDVAAFEAALHTRIPVEKVLSHDLFESLFARCALVSDVEVFEEFPSHAEVAAARTHRWTRGDWQLLPWALSRTDPAIDLLGRWKMVDNLRRSLSAPGTLATLVSAWAVPMAPTGWWMSLVGAAIFAPTALALMTMLGSVLIPRADLRQPWLQLPASLQQAAHAFQHGLMTLVLLPHYAWLTLDAIIRTLYRLTISRRHLLEWVTAAQAKQRASFALGNFVWPLRGATIVALCVTALVLTFNISKLPWALPFVIIWWLSPLVARAVSLPDPRADKDEISAASREEFRAIGRATWQYFATFVGATDHHLPPDNFQEDPTPVVAHRTSPTNIGLYLLSAIAAHDLGWIGRRELVESLEATFKTLDGMPRHHGHFFNWYDTLSAEPLPPLYVSSVDSGNLAGHLLVIAQACTEFATGLGPTPAFTGVRDALRVFSQALDRALSSRAPEEADSDALLVIAGVATNLDLLLATPSPYGLEVWEEVSATAAALLDSVLTSGADDPRGMDELQVWARAIDKGVASLRQDLHITDAQAGALQARLEQLAANARRLFSEMDFRMLFNPKRELFSIGLRVDENILDEGHYDLLASEARLTSFIAVASGVVSPLHWWRLGRSLARVERGVSLVSWSGSMFEYLMPSLVMHTPTGSLLEQGNYAAVYHQAAYAATLSLPWGMSESAYNVRDRALTYQYKAFGVPRLGLKRGLIDDAVIAPYATALAAMVTPTAAVANFKRLTEMGARGRFGFIDALDFTATRVPEGARCALVRAYMAHHQGMTVVALANAVDDKRMCDRFHREPIVRAAELLLQEKVPSIRPAPRRYAREGSGTDNMALAPPLYRRFTSAHYSTPPCQLLSNGRYSVMVTAAGGGYSQWRNCAVTRWHSDATSDNWGSHLYLRDLRSRAVWSACLQPLGVEADRLETVFAEDAVRFMRMDRGIESKLEIVVSPEDDAELRHLTLINHGQRTREIEVTSYAEVVLAAPATDAAHPAFSNLFVQTEFNPEVRCLLAARRSREDGKPELWAAHVLAAETPTVEYETDRAQFLGRGNTVRNPKAMTDPALTQSVGPVLDPIFSLRTRVTLKPNDTAKLTFTTLIARTKDEVLALADKYSEPAAHERSASLAWTHARVRLHHLGITPGDANLFQRLASSILYADPRLRPGSEIFRGNRLNARALWRLGLGGDLPIVLLRIDSVDEMRVAQQTMQAHQYLRDHGLAFDLVVLDEEPPSYALDFFHTLEGLGRRYSAITESDAEKLGRIFVLRAVLLSAGELRLLRTTARAELMAKHGSLAEQLPRSQALAPPRIAAPDLPPDAVAVLRPSLEFDNGIGGFSGDGREYVILLAPGQHTPAPWVNVIANPEFGCLVSEAGGGFTWASNSRENQLTPWSNDAVSDPPGEAIFLTDEDSGSVWSPTAVSASDQAHAYECRHGQGYSVFKRAVNGINTALTVFVAPLDPVKYSMLVLENPGGQERRLTVTGYTEWVLGTHRAASAPFVITEFDSDTGALLATNPWNMEFGERVAFAACQMRTVAFTADRTEFIGRNGTLAAPVALHARGSLRGSHGAGFDPCAVLQTSVTLAPRERKVVTFLLGQGSDREVALALVAKHRASDPNHVLAQVRAHWDRLLTQVQIETPDRALNLLVNRWLRYQVISCRLWGRAGFYQAGGAYGFRDQLQDSMAIVTTDPALARAQLLLSASRQFIAGDVQHWWHPPLGRGVRTRCSDDRLWLPFVIAHYVETTGDLGVLDEQAKFLDGPALSAEQSDAYFEPEITEHSASIFEHGARALDISLTRGSHGLPLIGSGDWNDGMNQVGAHGSGESVWLGWFLHLTLQRYTVFALARGEEARAARWRDYATALAGSLENAWDGAWYQRAYFDDGTALGTAAAMECRIDSIAQSWGVISGLAPPVRARQAMAAVNKHLIESPGRDLVLLFTPPFGDGPLLPGYIKGYPPGIRENGGQYTHAAAWCAIAFALLKDPECATDLLQRLNPINHARTRERALVYKVEPYVVAADVYAESPHVRRGGWTWYTGAAGWLYRASVEFVLGLSQQGDELLVRPCLPAGWARCRAVWRHGATQYQIAIENPDRISGGIAALTVDDESLGDGVDRVRLLDDGQTHRIDVLLVAPTILERRSE